MGNFNFRAIEPAGGTVANIFIHGYSAGHDLDDRYKLVGELPAGLPGCVNIFAFWDSGHLMRLSKTTKSKLMGVARINPWLSVGYATVDRAAHFYSMRKRAELVGQTLLEELDTFLLKHYPYVDTVNFIGHSLGARVVVTAMKGLVKNRIYSCISVRDVLLMAGAVSISKSESVAILTRIDGDVFSLYSKSDSVLLLNVDEDSIGRRPVDWFKSVEMKHPDGNGFGHTDYWPNLGRAMDESGFLARFSQNVELQNSAPFIKWSSVVHVDKTDDFVRDDYLLYGVLCETPALLLDLLIAHLELPLKDVKPSEKAFGITRAIQLLGGGYVSNFVRGRGVAYVQALESVAVNYLEFENINGCVSVSELERKLISALHGDVDLFFDTDPSLLLKNKPSFTSFLNLNVLKFPAAAFHGMSHAYKSLMYGQLVTAILLVSHARNAVKCRYLA